MPFYESIIYPLLCKCDPESAHGAALRLLELTQRSSLGQAFLGAIIAGEIPSQQIKLFGLTFPNILGLAAGFDKNAVAVHGLSLLGFGHVEVGTVTPFPQIGNPIPRVFRLVEDQAIINHMGFPNLGASHMSKRLKIVAESERDYIIGVSLGKQKDTPLDEAIHDYEFVMNEVYPSADYLAVNISSPNTPELRDLQGPKYVEQLLADLMSKNISFSEMYQVPVRPLLLKIAPDLTFTEIDKILDAVIMSGFSGIIVTNTTIGQNGIQSEYQNIRGGLSGRPFEKNSSELIAYINKRTKGELPIIGVAGIFDADDVRTKLAAGASLVQIYTGFVYKGPGMAGRINRQLAKMP